MIIADSIKKVLPKIESAKKFMGLVGKRSQTVDKSLAGTLMSTLCGVPKIMTGLIVMI